MTTKVKLAAKNSADGRKETNDINLIKELLVFGYIRRIQKHLQKGAIIPHEIYMICTTFYSNVR